MATNIAIEPPGKMCLTGDLCANWKSFRQRFDLYLTVTGKKNNSDEQKVAMLLMIAGPAVIDVYTTLDFGEAAPGADRSQVLSVVLEKLDNYFAPRRNEVYSRYLLRCRKQEKDEPFDSFLTDLKTRAKDCNFEGQRDKMIRDQVIFGIHNEDVRIKLLELEDSTLEKVAKACAVQESSAKQLKCVQTRNKQSEPRRRPSARCERNGAEESDKDSHRTNESVLVLWNSAHFQEKFTSGLGKRVHQLWQAKPLRKAMQDQR
ncbi:hypothetical protein MTO96_047921 [Rhipicephalus appendiculatus]